jgi:catechol 2,3-dioxygenase-like lactoylglutathione lyase family enzyme
MDMPAPKLTRILETGLYVADINRSRDFYEDVMGLRSFVSNDRFCALDVGDGASVLLLFLRGGTLEWIDLPGGRLPPHDGSGTSHFAFAIDAHQLPAWRQRLAECGVPVMSEVSWPLGGHSLYFEDPDKHVVEIATPGVWPVY